MSDKKFEDKRKCVRLDFRTDVNFNIVETSDEKTPKKLFRAVGKNVAPRECFSLPMRNLLQE